ncbi:Bug family tripartite tricarboxylate transporter substrate binding protein [Roseomonas xinghualingensis]|uniref:Bug family tripartite tricarboxylate transporter substrate binding protein n=1 Tax=Roseomonas xinghualingensis TaxID=2986475 RepID=UPI0021F1FD9B|nr:tripartite tricarboxylate transporter substrate binding protein [Roseomonas sp. SXEYE001]MCV4206358.1 tripartite tricarboxylate transporter substrate binding protein [Roseomonas sp. SXEYE001]
MLARRPLLGAGLALPFIRPAVAQGDWPNRTVRIIVPYPPAGSVDVLTRILAERLQQQLGQNFVIENRGGAGGNIGMDVLAKADPDGYTIGSATIGHFSINRYLYSRMPFDSDKDFAPVSLTWELPNVFVVSSQHVPARTLQEFIAWAKQKQGGLSFGSPGVGTTPHLSGALFNSRVGLNADHVPFRGAAQTIPAMLSGDVTFALDNLSSYVPVVQEGRMRALAVTSPERVPSLPDVPTMAEAGVPDFVVTSWSAFVFPAGTPRPIVDRLNAALKAIAADPSLQSRFGQVGAKALWSTPEAVTERGQKERPMWQEAVRISGARAD